MLTMTAVLISIAGPFPQDPPAPDSTRLPEIVVSASRAAPLDRLRGVAATGLSGRDLDRRGINRLDDALRLAPGTGITRTGAPGGVSATFLRGVNSGQALLLVDGVRVNDANLLPGSLLGGFEIAPSDRVEVVRGPQSPLYGGAGLGGVIAIGRDPFDAGGWQARVDAGSFATYRARVSGSTIAGALSVAGSASLVDTDNQRPDNGYDQRTQSLQLTHRPGGDLTLGATFRGMQHSYTSPGDLRTTNTTPVSHTTFENHLATAFAEVRVSDAWSSRLTAGWQDYFLRGSSRFNGGEPFVADLAATRWVTDWQHRFRPTAAFAAAAGVNAEWAEVVDGPSRRNERLQAAYAEVRVGPAPQVAVTAGVRVDDYTTFGTAVTGRLSAAYALDRIGATLRGSAGTGFMPPSLASRFGSVFQAANPDILPERSTGWDLGADVRFAGGRGSLGATVFANALRDLIGFESASFPDLGRSINLARARTRGLEVEGRYAGRMLDARAAYTWLEARALDEPDPTVRRLIRRPAHALSADVTWQAFPRLRLGGGVVAQLDREDTDFNAFPAVRVSPGDFADVRLHAAARLTHEMGLRAAIDNLFDTRYEEVYGFPALGRRLSIGLELGR